MTKITDARTNYQFDSLLYVKCGAKYAKTILSSEEQVILHTNALKNLSVDFVYDK